ncbi:MAG: SAM-dependent methyltransferase [Phycisphaerae bacterium]|nr:SAM-dependent methyltransferase [Gemmatimonadaceae bacterium]
MTMSFFESDRLSAADSIAKAQHIAFAPMVFQASRALRTLGILDVLYKGVDVTMPMIVEKTGLSNYGVRVLLEAGLGIGLVTLKDGVYKLTKTGWFILHDKMTIANMDFSHDVCYEGLATLDESIVKGAPTGLKAFGEWSTIYQGLAHMPEQATKSWYAFDHFYSDDAYPSVIPMIARHKLGSILDIGGNTGRFALQCLRSDANIRIGIVDLPNMANAASATINEQGFGDRVSFHPTNMLDPQQSLPTGFDAVWMSQFLDCFSEAEIVAILGKVRASISDDAVVFIMEPFWDLQTREVSAFCLQMTSLYFTGLANGNSQMYNSEVFLRCVSEAGLTVCEQTDNIGVCQTLLECRKA